MTFDLFCPNCSHKLLRIAENRINVEWKNDSFYTDLFKKSEKFKTAFEVLKENNNSTHISSTFLLEFYACLKCGELYMHYGKFGIYFDFLGKLTDEFIAAVVSKELTKQDGLGI